MVAKAEAGPSQSQGLYLGLPHGGLGIGHSPTLSQAHAKYSSQDLKWHSHGMPACSHHLYPKHMDLWVSCNHDHILSDVIASYNMLTFHQYQPPKPLLVYSMFISIHHEKQLLVPVYNCKFPINRLFLFLFLFFFKV